MNAGEMPRDAHQTTDASVCVHQYVMPYLHELGAGGAKSLRVLLGDNDRQAQGGGTANLHERTQPITQNNIRGAGVKMETTQRKQIKHTSVHENAC